LIERGRCTVLRFVECFYFCRGTVVEGLVQAVVVEPGDPLDDREFQLAAGAPDAV